MCNLRLTDGRPIEVLHPGEHNHDSGPDFFNAKIRIAGDIWAGNVEIHTRASDWYRHGHHKDSAYGTVVLHVVGVDDARIYRSDGSEIPQTVIMLPQGFMSVYESLSSPQADIRCRSWLSTLPRLIVTDWLETLAVQRMQQKARRVVDIYDLTGGDWEQTCFVILSRSLGFGLNNDPFEIMARSVPLKYLCHHSNSVLQLESILFGQAGLLDSSSHIFDEYYQKMCREYVFLARKYNLRPSRLNWKFARTRPQNFPHRRVAMLASCALGGFSLFRKIIDTEGNVDKLRELFNFRIEGYWRDHFSFDTEAVNAPCTLSKSSIDILLINVAAPLLYAYGAKRDNYSLEQSAMGILEELRPEQNRIVRTWASLGLIPDNALRSQALLHLRKEYCDASKCLYCRFGKRFVQGAAIDAF
ncbi:MAG: DUF2851 family protein [Prevotella sp.]|nr:DUF2851 family protein [Prevotella sp.]